VPVPPLDLSSDRLVTCSKEMFITDHLQVCHLDKTEAGTGQQA